MNGLLCKHSYLLFSFIYILFFCRVTNLIYYCNVNINYVRRTYSYYKAGTTHYYQHWPQYHSPTVWIEKMALASTLARSLAVPRLVSVFSKECTPTLVIEFYWIVPFASSDMECTRKDHKNKNIIADAWRNWKIINDSLRTGS